MKQDGYPPIETIKKNIRRFILGIGQSVVRKMVSELCRKWGNIFGSLSGTSQKNRGVP
jgi:hypothetical protein